MYALIVFTIFSSVLYISGTRHSERLSKWKTACKDQGGQLLETSDYYYCMKNNTTINVEVK